MSADPSPLSAAEEARVLDLLAEAEEWIQRNDYGEQPVEMVRDFITALRAAAQRERALLAELETARAQVAQQAADLNNATQALIYAIQKHPDGEIGTDWSSWRVGYGWGMSRGYGTRALQQIVSAVCQATGHPDPYEPAALAPQGTEAG